MAHSELGLSMHQYHRLFHIYSSSCYVFRTTLTPEVLTSLKTTMFNGTGGELQNFTVKVPEAMLFHQVGHCFPTFHSLLCIQYDLSHLGTV